MNRAAVCLVLVACGHSVDHGTAVDHGRALFSDPRASTGKSNVFSCWTCHPSDAKSDRIFPGYDLAGATTRKSFWGDKRRDLLESINDCRLSFMDARAPWSADEEDARAMYAYLASRAGSPAPHPLTIVLDAPDLPAGDPARGRKVYAEACQVCHGWIHDGTGRLADFVPPLPDKVDAQHAQLPRAERRLVYLRKVRGGAFTGIAGSMPPFSREALSDADLASVLAFLGQY